MSICIFECETKLSQRARAHGPPTEGGTSRHSCYKHDPPTEGRNEMAKLQSPNSSPQNPLGVFSGCFSFSYKQHTIKTLLTMP